MRKIKIFDVFDESKYFIADEQFVFNYLKDKFSEQTIEEIISSGSLRVFDYANCVRDNSV
jgi:hypothetical protein